MILELQFICEDCLGVRIDLDGRKVIASIVGRGEPAVRAWQRKNELPDKSFEKIKHHLEGTVLCETLNYIEETELSGLAMPCIEWRNFCLSLLKTEDFIFRRTFNHLCETVDRHIEIYRSFVNCSDEKMVYLLKEALCSDFYPIFRMPDEIDKKLTDARNVAEMRPAIKWIIFESFIYFMALAEAEWLLVFKDRPTSLVCKKVLPNPNDARGRLPLNMFFDDFFDNFIARGDFSSLDEISQRLTRVVRVDSDGNENATNITKDSAMREIKRAKYEGKPPSFQTFRAWIDVLFQGINGIPPDQVQGVKQIHINMFGVARIFDRFYREMSKEFSETVVLEHLNRYQSWFDHHVQSLNPS